MRLIPATLALVALWARAAAAEEPAIDLKLEVGSELDTNPHRAEQSALVTSIEPAGVMRATTRGFLRWRPAPRRAIAVNALAAARKVLGGDMVRLLADDSGVLSPQVLAGDAEDALVVAADVRADAMLVSGPVVSARGSYYDDFERDSFEEIQVEEESFLRNVSRDFRTADGSLGLTLDGPSGDRLSAQGGFRTFHFKPNPDFDFDGPSAGLSYHHRFLVGAEGEPEDTRTFDLSLAYLANRRAFQSHATNNVCAEGEPITLDCRQEAPSLKRVDFFHAVSAELVYTGRFIASARYELHWNDSTSFGESLLRHRAELAGTIELPLDVYLTARLIVQVNQFLDGLLLTGDVGTLVTIEDENRNALMFYAMRDLGTHWSVEARYAFYANEFATEELRFRRHVVYGGLVYAFRP